MTNERAIELLNRISDSQFDGIHGDERREALSMAVRALKQNLVKESGGLVQDLVKDCISRKMVIETITRISGIRGDVLKALYDLPSVQPELIEQGAYVRGFEQRRTQGMIDAKEGKK